MTRDHLYIIQMSVTGAFKVGRSSDVKRRLRQLQTGCPYVLRIILAAEGLGHREKGVHRALVSFRTRYGKGEWFREDGIGSIPIDIWNLVPMEILEDPDWWKSARFRQDRAAIVIQDRVPNKPKVIEAKKPGYDLDSWFGLLD
jgi:hypothetical protein